jgi:hypothetical protein
MVQQEDLAAMGVITCLPHTPNLSLLDHATGTFLEPTQNTAPIPPHRHQMMPVKRVHNHH